MRVNLIFRDNGAGLSRDAEILTAPLQDLGAEVRHVAFDAHGIPRLRRRLQARGLGARADLNIHLQHVDVKWCGTARRNLLIPNQEWFQPAWVPLLGAFDLVLAKSRHACRLFRDLGAATRYVGFTSADMRDATAPAAPTGGVIHVAGQSRRKGTAAVLGVWGRHPDWPLLTVVQRSRGGAAPNPQPDLPNVHYLTERVSNQELAALCNQNAIHIRPSEAEGFGHPFLEAMSCGGIVITVDAPPMNELVRPDRGFLVPGAPGSRQGLDTLSLVQEDALEEAVAGALALSAETRLRMQRNARAWYEKNDASFRGRLREAILSLM